MSGSGAYVEMLPPDRPIHMIGQPIIKLVADGGPGGDLGDLPPLAARSAASSSLGSIWAGLKRALGMGQVPQEWEAPQEGREGLYPKKLRDMVEYDMSGMACTPTDLGCCGADMGNYGMPMGNYGMPMGQVAVTDFVRKSGQVDAGAALGQTAGQFVAPRQVDITDRVRQRGVDAGAALSGMGQFVSVTDFVRPSGRVDAGAALGQDTADQAKQLKNHCDGLEQRAKDIVSSVQNALNNSSLTADQKSKIASDGATALCQLKADWRRCQGRIRAILCAFKKGGDLKKFGLAGLDAKISEADKLAKCRAKLQAICDGKKNAGMGEPWQGGSERGTWNH
jgi:hypothetical protein